MNAQVKMKQTNLILTFSQMRGRAENGGGEPSANVT